jgi:ABC-type transport system substrate-binding protein
MVTRYRGTLGITVDGTILAIEQFKGTRFRQFFGFTCYDAEGLIDLDAQANLVPGLVESWEIIPDGRAYNFHVRKESSFTTETN